MHGTDRRFVYEEHSFTPDRYDALGLGPTSISTFIDWSARRAVKHVRGKRFLLDSDDLYFGYEEEDVGEAVEAIVDASSRRSTTRRCGSRGKGCSSPTR